MPQMKKWLKRLVIGLPLLAAVVVAGWSAQAWVRQAMVLVVLIWYPLSMLFEIA